MAKDMQSMKADIMCFQEFEQETCDYLMEQLSKDRNLHAHYIQRVHKEHKDGCGIFYDTDKFTLVQEVEINLNNAKPLLGDVKKNKKLWQDTFNVGQIVLLKTNTPEQHHVLVANAHIYFRPQSDIVKYAQVAYMMSEIHRVTEEFKAMDTYAGQEVHVIYAGDFNSMPESAVI